MNEVTTEQIESATLITMQRALENYSEEKHLSYEDALLEFSQSNTYNELFDYDTFLWTQGPDYLMSIYESEKEYRKAMNSLNK